MEVAEIVGTHHPYQACPGQAWKKAIEGRGRGPRTQRRFDSRHLNTGVVGKLTGGCKAPREIVGRGMRFQRIARRDHPPDLVELKATKGDPADFEMSFMGRIERAAEQPDAHPAEKRRQPLNIGFGRL